MSRLCRLKTASHGEDGKWAYQEIVNLREENAKQAEQIKRLRDALENCRLLAARNRKDEWAHHILRFCVEAGVLGSPIRDTDLSDTQPVQDSQDGFLLNGARFKVTHLDGVGYCIHGLPKELNGEWVAFVSATDNKHLPASPAQKG